MKALKITSKTWGSVCTSHLYTPVVCLELTKYGVEHTRLHWTRLPFHVLLIKCLTLTYSLSHFQAWNFEYAIYNSLSVHRNRKQGPVGENNTVQCKLPSSSNLLLCNIHAKAGIDRNPKPGAESEMYTCARLEMRIGDSLDSAPPRNFSIQTSTALIV